MNVATKIDLFSVRFPIPTVKPKLTIELTCESIVTIRHDGHEWRVTPRGGTPIEFWVHHHFPGGKYTDDFMTRDKTSDFLVDLVTERLQLSDFWSGQFFLSI